MRINKYIAACGVVSRRKADELIAQGRVAVNGSVVTELGTEVSDADEVAVDGKIIALQSAELYFMLNKPQGCVTTASDDRDRQTVLDIFNAWYKSTNKMPTIPRVFPVGRLDYNTQGLLILTTDGDLANLLMHPKNHIEKTYIAKVRPHLTDEDIARLEGGVVIDNEKTLPAKVKVLKTVGNKQNVQITICQGRNRQVRKMFEAVGKVVEKLERTRVGALQLGNLPRGQIRPLTEKEIAYLKSL